MYTLSTAHAALQMDRVHGWLAGSYWSPGIRREVCERAFANSRVVGAYAREAPGVQLGVARLVTDRATFAWLCDVYVDAAARRHGIARAMVATFLADPELATLRRWSLATRDAHAVYRGLGFGPVDPAVHMQLLPPVSAWSEPTS